MPGQRNCLFGNAFHQAAVAIDDVGIVVADIAAELGGNNPFRQSHTDGRSNPLPQRPGGYVNPFQVSVFRMPGGF